MSVYTMWRHFCHTVYPRILRKYFSISPCSLKNLGKLLENFPFFLFSGAQNSVSVCVSVTQESFVRTTCLNNNMIELESHKQFQQNTHPTHTPVPSQTETFLQGSAFKHCRSVFVPGQKSVTVHTVTGQIGQHFLFS